MPRIGRLTTQLGWIKKKLASSLTRDERLALLERDNLELTLAPRPISWASVRSSLYYQPVPPSAEEVRIKHRIDEIYTECPFYGFPSYHCSNSAGRAF